MLPKELAVAEAWLLAMLFVERARAFMIFPTFVLITSRSALKSPFQVVAAIESAPARRQALSTRCWRKLQRAFHTKSLPARPRNGRGRLGPRTSRWALQNKNCVCSKAGISFRAMESAATIPHPHGEHGTGEACADIEGG